jgi:hypothetical protein
VAEFLVECYVSRTDEIAVAHGENRARIAAADLTREGQPTHVLRSIFTPEDEIVFYLCEAGSIEAVQELARRAALPLERVARVAPVSSPASTAARICGEERSSHK